MNNNRGNNRRRGRGNNNGRPQGGGQQLNRIDSRARGNAPQLLEKYRKLAHDAHLNGDRVQAEYYLQFADHYFRVIADTRVRQEEARARREDRWQDNGEAFREDGEDGGDFSVESDFPAFDQPPVYTRREREDREPRENREQREPRENRGEGREERRPRREEAPQREAIAEPAAEEGAEASATPNIYEPVENPFVRENRASRGLRQRRPRRDESAGGEAPVQGEPTAEPAVEPVAAKPAPAAAVTVDPASLPPAISTGRKQPAAPAEAPVAEDAAPAPAPKRRTRRKTTPDAGETLEPVG